MVISISSTSTSPESDVATASPTSIMEDTVGYVPPQAEVVQDSKHIRVRPTRKACFDLPGPSGVSWGKHTGNRNKKGQETTPPTPPPHEEDKDSENRNLLPPYIQPRCSYAPKVRIPMKSRTC